MFVFRGALTAARIRRVTVAGPGLVIEADASGTGGLTYAPEEAAALVAARKARRLARERAKAEAAAAAAPEPAPAAAAGTPVP